MPIHDDMTYTNDRTEIVIVPNELRDAINKKLDQEIALQPDAAADREYLYNQILGYFSEYGRMPDFTLTRAE